tara:strand:+ start:276 stop:695 length:420 start_codon:yes stop_codon:yes gene_type:complete
LIPLLIIYLFIYKGCYPSEDFYREEFKEATSLELPKSAKFIYKTATYPDFQGEYTTKCIINVGKHFYKKLDKKLRIKGFSEKQKNGRYKISFPEKIKSKSSKIKYLLSLENWESEPHIKCYYVGFIEDEESIVVELIKM